MKIYPKQLVGDQGIEPCASRSQSERSTDELVPVGAGGGSRTHMTLRSLDFKSNVYAIPPHQLLTSHEVNYGIVSEKY